MKRVGNGVKNVLMPIPFFASAIAFFKLLQYLILEGAFLYVWNIIKT